MHWIDFNLLQNNSIKFLEQCILPRMMPGSNCLFVVIINLVRHQTIMWISGTRQTSRLENHTLPVQEPSVSQHNGGPVKGTLKAINTIVLWCTGDFRGALNCSPMMSIDDISWWWFYSCKKTYKIKITMR